MSTSDKPSAPNDGVATEESPIPVPADAGRRAALEKLGAMAAWTAPAMLTLLASKRASAVSPL